MSGVDYDQMVHVLSFDASSVEGPWHSLRSNPSLETTLAKAIRLVCSSEWASDGRVLNGILCANGKAIGADEARRMMAAPDFPEI